MLQYSSGKDWQICKCLLGCLLWALWSFVQWFPAKTDPKLALGLVLRSFLVTMEESLKQVVGCHCKQNTDRHWLPCSILIHPGLAHLGTRVVQKSASLVFISQGQCRMTKSGLPPCPEFEAPFNRQNRIFKYYMHHHCKRSPSLVVMNQAGKQIAERASAKAKEFVRSTGQLSGKVVVPAWASNGSNYETLGMGIACGNYWPRKFISGSREGLTLEKSSEDQPHRHMLAYQPTCFRRDFSPMTWNQV